MSRLFLLFLLYPLQCDTLETVARSQLQRFVERNCLVTSRDSNPDDQITSLLQKLEDAYWHENNIKIVLLEPDITSTESNNDVAVYPKIKQNRACLLAPFQPKPKPKVYTGPLQVPLLVHFINEHCGTFRTATGELNRIGRTRRAILDNLYEVKFPSERCKRISMPVTAGEFFSEYLSRSQPVIIEKAAANWTAMHKWTINYLRETFGHRKIHVKVAPHGEFEGCEDVSRWEDHGEFHVPDTVLEQLLYPDLVVVRPATIDILFSDFLDIVVGKVNAYRTNNVSAYLEYSSIREYMAELEDDIDEMAFVKRVLKRRHLNMWLSDGNTLGKLHFDPFDNLLCQLSGTKHVTLFEPYNNTRLYEAHIAEAKLGFNRQTASFRRKTLLDSTSMVMSPIDIRKPDLKRFPEFGKVARMECTIHAGDVLFMPAFWWHEVQSTPDQKEHRNMAVNYW